MKTLTRLLTTASIALAAVGTAHAIPNHGSIWVAPKNPTLSSSTSHLAPVSCANWTELISVNTGQIAGGPSQVTLVGPGVSYPNSHTVNSFTSCDAITYAEVAEHATEASSEYSFHLSRWQADAAIAAADTSDTVNWVAVGNPSNVLRNPRYEITNTTTAPAGVEFVTETRQRQCSVTVNGLADNPAATCYGGAANGQVQTWTWQVTNPLFDPNDPVDGVKWVDPDNPSIELTPVRYKVISDPLGMYEETGIETRTRQCGTVQKGNLDHPSPSCYGGVEAGETRTWSTTVTNPNFVPHPDTAGWVDSVVTAFNAWSTQHSVPDLLGSWTAWTPSTAGADEATIAQTRTAEGEIQEYRTEYRKVTCTADIVGPQDYVDPTCSGLPNITPGGTPPNEDSITWDNYDNLSSYALGEERNYYVREYNVIPHTLMDTRTINNPAYMPGNVVYDKNGLKYTWSCDDIVGSEDERIYSSTPYTLASELNKVEISAGGEGGEGFSAQCPADSAALIERYDLNDPETQNGFTVYTYNNSVPFGLEELVPFFLTPVVESPDTAAWVNPVSTGEETGGVETTETEATEWTPSTGPADEATITQTREVTTTTTTSAVTSLTTHTCEVTVNGYTDPGQAPTCTAGGGTQTTVITPESVTTSTATEEQMVSNPAYVAPAVDAADTATWTNWSLGTWVGGEVTLVNGEWTEWSPTTAPSSQETIEQSRSRSVTRQTAERTRLDTRTCNVTVNGNEDIPAPSCDPSTQSGGVLLTPTSTEVTTNTAGDERTLRAAAKATNLADEVQTQTVDNPAYVEPASVTQAPAFFTDLVGSIVSITDSDPIQEGDYLSYIYTFNSMQSLGYLILDSQGLAIIDSVASESHTSLHSSATGSHRGIVDRGEWLAGGGHNHGNDATDYITDNY